MLQQASAEMQLYWEGWQDVTDPNQSIPSHQCIYCVQWKRNRFNPMLKEKLFLPYEMGVMTYQNYSLENLRLILNLNYFQN